MTRIHALLLPFLLTQFVGLPAQQATDADLKQLRKNANAAVQAGDFATAAAGFRKLTDASPEDGDAWHMLGYALHAAGKLDEALPIHLKAASFPKAAPASSYNVACVHALQGRADEAFTWLDKAVGLGFADADLLAKDTDLASLRKDERFAKVQKTVQTKAATAMQAFAQTTDRKSARVAWFGRTGSPGQISIDYCPVPWNDEYAAVVAGGKLMKKKWRFGGDFWTSLDTSIDLKFGAVNVPAGYYYLTLEQREADTFVLALHDAAAAKKQKLDPVFADRLAGGIEVTLTHVAGAAKADHLAITLGLRAGSANEGSLQIRFGDHELSSPVTMKAE